MVKVSANGIELEVEQHGNQASAPILLIRGLGSQIIHWPEPLIRGLVDSGFRVIAYDNRDAGLSQKFDAAGCPDIPAIKKAVARGDSVRVPYTLRDMAGDGIGVLDALGIESAHVLGISMGGMILQTMAHHYPGRLKSATIVMSSSGAPNLPSAPPEITDFLNAKPSGSDRESIVMHTLMCDRVWASPLYPFEEVARRSLIERAFDRSYCPDGITRQLAAIITDTMRYQALRDLKLPTLVVHGTDDTLIPIAHGRDIAARIPEAEFFEIEGMGHDLEGAVSDMIVVRIRALVC